MRPARHRQPFARKTPFVAAGRSIGTLPQAATSALLFGQRIGDKSGC